MPTELEPGVRPMHILMRYSDKITGIEDTISAHMAVAKQKGAVWLGKMGKTMARKHVDTINQQCAKKIPTHLYLVQRHGVRYEVFQANIAQVTRIFPPAADRPLIPPYYDKQQITRYIRFWQKLTSIKKVDNSVLNRIYIATSGSTAADTLRHSMAALFFVRES